MNEGDFITTALTGIAEGRNVVPQRLSLSVLPTVSREGFRVEYGLAQGGQAVSMRVYDRAGRLVRTLVDGDMPAGWYELLWQGDDNQGHDLASGVYFVSLTSGEHKVITKALVVR
jgi:flagellar hook assembly protein FlgD